jgi:hypothetical protein
LPSTATVGLSGKDGARIVHIKATYPSIRNGRGIIEEHNFIPEAKVSLRGEYSRAVSLPDETPVPFEVNNGRVEFLAKDILGYKSFLLEK